MLNIICLWGIGLLALSNVRVECPVHLSGSLLQARWCSVTKVLQAQSAA